MKGAFFLKKIYDKKCFFFSKHRNADPFHKPKIAISGVPGHSKIKEDCLIVKIIAEAKMLYVSNPAWAAEYRYITEKPHYKAIYNMRFESVVIPNGYIGSIHDGEP